MCRPVLIGSREWRSMIFGGKVLGLGKSVLYSLYVIVLNKMMRRSAKISKLCMQSENILQVQATNEATESQMTMKSSNGSFIE